MNSEKAKQKADKKNESFVLRYLKKYKRFCLRKIKKATRKREYSCSVQLPNSVEKYFNEHVVYDHLKEEFEKLGYQAEVNYYPYILFGEHKFFCTLKISWGER